jgi:hypothetical protein
MKETPKAKIGRRAREAAAVAKLADGLFKALEKIPSYTGKARFMDRVIKVKKRSELLAENLAYDVKHEL